MNGLREPTIRKFNPGTFQSDDEVIRQFVVREHELGVVLEVLRGNVDSPSCQHLLLVAPRGRGKTMLLARVAAELRKDGELAAQLLPVRFMEESLEVLDPGDFWLETLFHLAAEVARRDPACAEELRRTRAALAAERREGSVEERALAALLDAADRLDRKLVLMVENLQDLYGDTGDDFGWTLRKTLQTEPRIVLLATATGRFEGLDDTARPFFELFRTVPLHPLDAGECRRLWEAVGGEGRDARRIRPLQILTGGDPRLLVIVAGLARDRSLRRLMEELVSLIDEHTEYFRGHLDGFAKIERRVYLAVIDLWRPSSAPPSAGEVAARARLDIRTVSALLGRLVGRGAVVAEEDGAKRRYAAAQCLYCIYYKLRRERDEAAVVRNLIQFLVVFYVDGEWAEVSGALFAEAALSPVIREGVERAMAELPQLRERFAGLAPPDVERASERAAANDEERVERRLDKIVAALHEERFEEVIRIASPLVDSRSAAPLFVASALVAKATAYRALGDADAAIAVYDDVVERFGRSDALELQAPVAVALFNKGVAQGECGDADAAIAAYDDVVERFGRSDALELQAPVAVALFNKGVAQRGRGDADAAIAAYDDVVERFGRSDALELQTQVAMALFNKGVAQRRRGDADAAMAAYDDVVERFGRSDALELQTQVAMALINKGVAQRGRGDADAAIVAYDDVVERFGRSDALELQTEVAMALVNKGVAQRGRGDVDAAIAAYDDVVERFGRSDALELQAPVAKALVGKGVAQRGRGDVDAAIAAYDDVVERFGRSDALELQAPVAKALVGKGVAQGGRGDADAAIAAYDDVVERFGSSGAPELQASVAVALVNKGVAQGGRGDVDAAMAAYDYVVERFGRSDALELQASVAVALVNKGVAQGGRGDVDAAMAAYDYVVERFGRSDALELQASVAVALVNKGVAQGGRGDVDAAMAAYDYVVERFGRSDALELQTQVAMALVNKGVAQGGRGDVDAAIAAYDYVVERFGRSDAPELQASVAVALVNKGVAQRGRGDADAAIAAYDDVIERFGSSDAPKLRMLVAMALVGRGEAQLRLGRTEDALHSLGELERGFSELMEREDLAIGWQANRAKTKALLAQGRRPAALEAFRSVHAALASGNEAMPGVILELAPALIAAGVSERDLVSILSSDEEKSDALAPLIVALRRRAGEEVRAPAEVIEVADDVLRRIEEDVERALANGASPAH